MEARINRSGRARSRRHVRCGASGGSRRRFHSATRPARLVLTDVELRDFELVFNPFVTLLVVVNPLRLMPIFGGSDKGCPEKRKREAAIRGTVLGTAILLLFAFAGDALLGALGIGLAAFRTGGGILLFLLRWT
jgi:hypothetical protein